MFCCPASLWSLADSSLPSMLLLLVMDIWAEPLLSCLRYLDMSFYTVLSMFCMTCTNELWLTRCLEVLMDRVSSC